MPMRLAHSVSSDYAAEAPLLRRAREPELSIQQFNNSGYRFKSSNIMRHIFLGREMVSTSCKFVEIKNSHESTASIQAKFQEEKFFEVEMLKTNSMFQIRIRHYFRSFCTGYLVWFLVLAKNNQSDGGDLGETTPSCLSSIRSRHRHRLAPPSSKTRSAAARRLKAFELEQTQSSRKAHRMRVWDYAEEEEEEEPVVLSSVKFSALKVSLREVCSFEDLKQRMRGYLSAESCREVLSVMSQVAKNIDDGRLKMKAHCPIVTDLGMKEKACKVIMSYNPIWLRIGLYVVIGGDSLLPTGDVNSDQELSFLKAVVEKQIFSHEGLAKAFAYNKRVEGLYRPGYFEALGNVILKRILLLVLILDRAKSQSSLPIKYGIDGTDGGSPLLFHPQSNIKSSGQVVQEFLSSEIMHGEGNLLAHLVIVGYKIPYQQHSLFEYDFRVTNLFEDLQDGVRLCRAIHLLQQDTSILMKMVVPSDTIKKNLANCRVAMDYIKQAGVPLSDEDGTIIVAEDVSSGEKELVLNLLWNLFTHLQLPLLINKKLLFEEICKVKRVDTGNYTCYGSNHLEMLLEWVQAISLIYDVKVDSFASLVDGKALWCLIDYYFGNEFHCSCCYQNNSCTEEPKLWIADCSDAVNSFILSQKLATMLGNFPEASTSVCRNNKGLNRVWEIFVLRHCNQLQASGLLNLNCAYSVRKFKVIQAWWRDMTRRNQNCQIQRANNIQCLPDKLSRDAQRERAVKIVQSHFRGFVQRRKFLKIKYATFLLQAAIRGWLLAKNARYTQECSTRSCKTLSSDNQKHANASVRYIDFLVARHYFVSLRKSALLIQKAARAWIAQRRQDESMVNLEVSAIDEHESEIGRVSVVKEQLQMRASADVQSAWTSSRCTAATKIQSHWRGWLMRRKFLHLKNCVIKLQIGFRCLQYVRAFQQYKTATRSAVIIQSRVRGMISRREASKERQLIVMIQSHWRGWLSRRDFLHQREAAVKIQSCLRCLKCWRTFQCFRRASIDIQRYVRGQVFRKRLLGAAFHCLDTFNGQKAHVLRGSYQSPELSFLLHSVLKLQRWWKRVLLCRAKTRSAITIQSYVRGWIARREAYQQKHRIVVIQSYWKGFLARKELRGQLLDLRLRVQKSAANVDDDMRLINRLVYALSELLNTRSISSIIHTCATLDIATEHSEKCCETLVAAGAIETLLKLIRSVSRSIPDQQVLKHALATLRNLARYPHLAAVLVDSNRALEVIMWEYLRNKDEGFFIASELLKTLCSTKKGIEAISNLSALLKRLHNLVEDLTRKVTIDKRNSRPLPGKENTERRLKEANELLKLATTAPNAQESHLEITAYVETLASPQEIGNLRALMNMIWNSIEHDMTPVNRWKKGMRKAIAILPLED
ncbi:hypothetical protein Scep_012974 [Stephania cephalantha]|uniref:Calponin-homology (CH) domain-containing protein n=1 Tax=Stephania cephalantha TaxID=152367 RepID=A0AAP0JG52_9MAGN